MEFIIALVIAIAISWLITKGMIASMNTAVKQRAASNYIRSNSFNLSDQSDRFVREETTSRYIGKDDHDDDHDDDD